MTNQVDTALIEARKAKFLSAYAETGVIGPAADAAGIDRSTYKRWRKADEDFDAACDDAFQGAVDDAELELRTRAVDGNDEPILYKGQPVWRRHPDTGDLVLDDDFEPVPFTVSKRSDRLLEVYVRSHRPVYKEKTEVALTGGGGGPLDVTVRYVLPKGKTAEDYDTTVPGDEPDPLD